ncbi:hypothetical protein F0562_032032 [Nyssa sinensis]|uniref:Uncharacterized protein n=1 Tax=Nyssa sinensis TaxID=561372 RepID=A0A5J5ATS0_9ASTE|nr:hypothetical protein F0562_032032 [Nyssa sinensis]
MYKTKFEIPLYVDVFGDEYDVVSIVASPILLEGAGSVNLSDEHDKGTKVDVESDKDWGIDKSEVGSDNDSDNSKFEYELEDNQSEDELSNYDSDKSVDNLSESNGSNTDLMSKPKGLDPTKFEDEFHVKKGEAFDFHLGILFDNVNKFRKETYLAAHGGIIHPIIDHSMLTLATGDPIQTPPYRSHLIDLRKIGEKKLMKQLQDLANRGGPKQLVTSFAKDLATTKEHAKGHLWQLGEEAVKEAGTPQLPVIYIR